MKERPILFSGPMVRAILDGRKTQTRRVVKPQPGPYIDELHGNALRTRAPYKLECYETGNPIGFGFQDDDDRVYRCPYGEPGDRLWVRETWAPFEDCGTGHHLGRSVYRATWPPSFDERHDAGLLREPKRWRPSIHMPRRESRITLEVTGVRVERVQEISEVDAIAEGSQCPGFPASVSNRGAFAKLWDYINDARGYGWDSNPWVWVVEFKRLEAE